MSRLQIALVLAASGLATALIVAGPTTPPAGPITSTYKTLSEVEPRRAVQSLPGNAGVLYVIDQPGSYYLTGNIQGQSGKQGLNITASNVTIDLGGHTLSGGPGSITGIIYSPGVTSVTIRNGVIAGWGGAGIGLGGVTGVRVENVRVSECGGFGIDVADDSIVTGCQSVLNTGPGFWIGEGSRIVDCVARGNHGDGIVAYRNSVVSGCASTLNDYAGILGYTGSTITDCTSSENIGPGIFGFQAGVTISNCTTRHNSADGIRLDSQSYVSGCTCSINTNGSTSAGIHAVGVANRIDGNMVNSNDIGIKLDAAQNLVVRNTWSYNPVGVSAASGNNVAQVLTTPGNAFTATNPWANFAH